MAMLKSRLNQKGIAGVIEVIIIAVVIGALGFVVWRVIRSNSNTSSKSGNSQSSLPPEVASDIPKCSSEPIFNNIPMELSDFRAFRPLGFVNVPIHIFGAKHSNFAINLPNEHVSGKRVEFPADVTVTNITSTVSASGSGYQITFYPCREFKSYLFHLGTISDQLKSEYDKSSPKCQDFTFDASGKITKCEANTKVKVKSGDLAGTSDSFGGVDWGAVDYRVTAEYANPDRYDGDYPHYTSPVLYLRQDLKNKMLSKMGSFDGQVMRTAEPRVGALAQDKSGTAQGNWFMGVKSFKNTQDFSPFLALIHDYVDPIQPIFSMGSSVKGLNKGIYSFRVESSGLNNRDFSTVKRDGQVYCYDAWASGLSAGHSPLTTTSGVILLQMPTDKTLQVEYQNGSCGTNRTITANATTFDR